MRVLGAIGVLAWAAWAMAGETKAAKAAPTPGEEAPKKGARLVVAVDKAPLEFGKEVIGELAEGTRLELKEQVKEPPYSKVRVAFGTTDKPNWVEGWIRTAMTLPDSLEDVGIKVASAKLDVDFHGMTLPGGQQFLEVAIDFQVTEKSPPCLYFNFADEATADLYLVYGRKKKALPYGFALGKPGAKKQELNTADKQQILRLRAVEGKTEPKTEKKAEAKGDIKSVVYVFVLPYTVHASDLPEMELTVKDKALHLQSKKH